MNVKICTPASDKDNEQGESGDRKHKKVHPRAMKTANLWKWFTISSLPYVRPEDRTRGALAFDVFDVDYVDSGVGFVSPTPIENTEETW